MTHGTTPAGGDSSRIIYSDADGNETTADKAESAEIIESVGGMDIHRTYLEKTGSTIPKWTPPGQVIAEPEVIDFTKATWDVFVNDNGQFRLVSNVADLLSALGLQSLQVSAQKKQVAELSKLPAWEAAPKALKQEATAWLKDS